MNFFIVMGFWRWPLMIFTLLIIYNLVRYSPAVMKGKTVTESVRISIDSILFWGVMSVATGILGQISGIYNALNIIIKATDISPQIVMKGFSESFTSTIYGFYIFILSGLIWYFLKRKIRMSDAKE
ncbi:MAG: MotA/TolQ/ExbB proton channel family protein [Candidatus Delongbacteria bacterium]|nr:MotA/TolQ/ExbB proton channel family protein [Candidatus Delongbacteria bacterium]